jgi:hypothetical protein
VVKEPMRGQIMLLLDLSLVSSVKFAPGNTQHALVQTHGHTQTKTKTHLYVHAHTWSPPPTPGSEVWTRMSCSTSSRWDYATCLFTRFLRSWGLSRGVRLITLLCQRLMYTLGRFETDLTLSIHVRWTE